MTDLLDAPNEPKPERRARPRRPRRGSPLQAQGEPMVWLTGGALAICLLMIFGLLGLVVYQGGRTFWPNSIVQLETETGQSFLGVVSRTEWFEPGPELLDSVSDEQRAVIEKDMAEHEGRSLRRLVRTANFEETGTHFDWVSESVVKSEEVPEWAVVLERRSAGRFYGFPSQFLVEGKVLAEGPEATWEAYLDVAGDVTERLEEAKELEEGPLGVITRRLRQSQLDIRRAELAHGKDTPEVAEAVAEHEKVKEEAAVETQSIAKQISELREVNSAYVTRFTIADGREVDVPVDEIVRAVPVNQLSFGEKLGVYASRWKEFLVDDPRKANSQGGVWPALFGTVIMTLIMSVLVVPFGVLAALYLREYAKQGFVVSVVRVAVNNLAGVPSIVFGVFGLGFFCYIVGAGIDDLLFAEYLPNPKYGKGGVLWASLTLALLTLPVVIVATEEALSAVPNSMREGSFACGATQWQTIRRIVLPRAMPGILTGMILAVARGAGEVAPLMLVGAVKLAPDLPVDLATFPYVFPERSFMHLGFHIYDVGFQSQDSEAAKPMVYTTTLLLIGLVVVLNLSAVAVRARLRRRFAAR